MASSTVNGKTVSYTYYPSGLTKTATPQGGQVLSMEYNLHGKRTKLTDPVAGIIETKYNGFGELVEEKQKIHSNNFLVTTHQFEPTTGRLNSINRNGEITSYGYDTQNRVNSIEITGQHKQIFSYDDFNRVTNIREEIGSNTYNRETAYDALGRIKKETYPSGYYTVNGKTVSYTYYTSGLTKTATPQGGQALSMEYNIQGNRTKITDPNAGVIETKYNGFGELVEEKQLVHSNDFIITSHQFEPTTGLLNSINRNGEITSYSYDTHNRISSIEIAGQNMQEFTYDKHDRVTGIREEINNIAFKRTMEYDALGRVTKDIYPSGYYTVNHYDNTYGFLTAVKDKNNRLLWKPLNENARGQLTQVQRGGKTTTFGYDSRGLPDSIYAAGIINLHYDFDAQLNLQSRIDKIAQQREVFDYDPMNRLTNWNVYHNNVLVQPNSMAYNATTGTITSKSDLDNLTMLYGENGKPHALTSIAGVPANSPTAELNVTYTDFKKIKTLAEGNKHYILTYGIDDQRRKSEYKVNGVTQNTKYYLGDYEEETDHLGNVKKIHYLSGGAILITANGVESLYYGYSDYQGNLTALANEAGTVVERYAYDAVLLIRPLCASPGKLAEF